MAVMLSAATLGGQVQPPAAPQGDPATGHSARTAIERWFDVQAAALMARYRRIETSDGTVNANHLQDGLLLRVRVKFDRKARYALNAGVATGPAFTAAWNNAGWGTGGPRTTGVYLKQLFLSAAPVRGLDLAYGSLGFVRGESTEITTFDNDGYMAGARATVKRPADLVLDEISVTAGYVGDLATPGFSDRADGLGRANYFHVLGGKKIGALLNASADYTHLSGAGILRGAVHLRTPRVRVVDAVRYEQYCRSRQLPACGFAATLDKTVATRVTLSGGYADIDADYGNTNADRFMRGRRFFEMVTVRVLRDLAVSAFAAQAVHNAFVVPNGRRFDLVVTFNALGPLQRAGLFR